VAQIIFQKAPEDIATGDSILSSDMIKLADSYNDRIMSGVGDFVWRLSWAASSVFRNLVVDAPDNYLFDFFHLDPRTNSLTSFPAGSLNDAGGINSHGNPFAAFVLGNDLIEIRKSNVSSSGNEHDFTGASTDYLAEAGRLGHVSTSAANNWLLAARQRGTYDPTTEELLSPFRYWAEGYVVADFAQSGNGFNESWGGYQPGPPLDDSDGANGNCNSDGSSPYWKFTVRFLKITAGAPTGLNAGTWNDPHVEFGDTCPEADPPAKTGQVTSDYGGLPYVLGWEEASTHYNVWSWDGTKEVKDTLLKSDYQFVEDGTGRLKHQKLEIGARSLFWFANALRGSDSDRAGEGFDIMSIAFDSDRYFTKQNRLAPAFGVSGGGGVTATYPEFTCTDNTADTEFDNSAGGTTHECHSDFAAAGIRIVVVGMDPGDTAKIIMKIDDEEWKSWTVGPDGLIEYWDDVVAGGEVSFVIGADSDEFTSITIEVADLLVEAGSFNQLACLLRAGVAGASYAVDGQPELVDNIDVVNDAYFDEGVMIIPGGGPRSLEDTIEESGLFDSARKTLKSFFSACDAYEFTGIRITSGNNEMEFNRYVDDATSLKKDIFSDMLPVAEIDSGDIKPGVKYVLFNRTGGAHGGGTWTYNGTTYANDVEVDGVYGETEFVINTSGYEVYQADGIIETPSQNQMSNEWVIIINAMLADSIGDIPSYQIPDYALNYPLVNRCTVASPNASNRLKYMARDAFPELYKPELPPGYTYDGNLQYGGPSDEFYASCMVYPKPYKITSIKHKQSAAGVAPDRVIIKIDGRLQHTDTAESSYGWDPATWNLTTLTNEAYRTDENALREWWAERQAGHGSDSKVGDNAFGSFNPTSGSKGARVPQFFFAKLIPKPQEDDNDSYESTDTLFTADIWRQLEFYLRVMCEGWIDPESTEGHDCLDTTVNYDYKFEKLCIQAFGKPWLYPVPLAQSSAAAKSFGNFPAQAAWAECFTNICKAVNLLIHARLILPFTIEYEQISYEDVTEITSPTAVDGGCSDSNPEVLKIGFESTEPTTEIISEAWTTIPFPAFSVETIATFVVDPGSCPVSDNHGVSIIKNRVNLRGAPDSAGMLNALSPELQDHIDSGGVSILAKRTLKHNYDTLTAVGGAGIDTVEIDGTHYQIVAHDVEDEVSCVIVHAKSTSIDPGAPPDGDLYRRGSSTNEARRIILYNFSFNTRPFLSFQIEE
jgi:hypothetical protein